MRVTEFLLLSSILAGVACSYHDEADDYMRQRGWEAAPQRCYEMARQSIASTTSAGAASSGSTASMLQASQEAHERPYYLAQCICEEQPDSALCASAKERFPFEKNGEH